MWIWVYCLALGNCPGDMAPLKLIKFNSTKKILYLAKKSWMLSLYSSVITSNSIGIILIVSVRISMDEFISVVFKLCLRLQIIDCLLIFSFFLLYFSFFSVLPAVPIFPLFSLLLTICFNCLFNNLLIFTFTRYLTF